MKLGPSQPSTHQFGCKGKWQSGAIVPASGSGDPAVGPNKTELVLTSTGTRIVTDAPALEPLSQLLADDIFDISGVRLNVSTASNGSAHSSNMGDIRLYLVSAGVPSTTPHRDPDTTTTPHRNPSTIPPSPPGTTASALPDESYSLSVSGKGAEVRCRSYTGCAWAVTTLLQLLCVSGVATQTIALPAVNISDAPDAPYRGVLLDTARSLVTVQDLFDAVALARLYKIRFLHLHLTDDHSWTFPSDSFPALGSANVGFRGRRPVVYTKQQLQRLVAYADQRGVTVVPELEGPGHSSAQRRAMPRLFGPPTNAQGGGVLTVTNESVYAAMTTIIREMASVFASSPYIHVGCDETGTPTSLPGYSKFAVHIGGMIGMRMLVFSFHIWCSVSIFIHA